MKQSKLLLAISSFIIVVIFSISFAIHTSKAQTTAEWKKDDKKTCYPCGKSCIVISAPRLPAKK